jgi:hypothetical protein
MKVTILSVATIALFQVNAYANQACPISSSAPDGARHEVQTVDYEGISLKELVAVYRASYIEAGFKFKAQLSTNEGRTIRLTLTLPIPGQPKKKEGNGSLVFYAVLGADDCKPCKVYREIMGVRYDYYKSEELVGAQSIVYSADEVANRRVKKKLGKSLYDIKPMPQGPC